MNYHLNQNGQDLGVFPLEELRRRRTAGELNGGEQVWCEGMTQWEPLDSVLQASPPPVIPKFISPPPLPPHHKKGQNPIVVVVVVICVAAFLGIAGLGFFGMYQAFRIMPAIRQAERHAGTQTSALTAASKPVSWDTNTKTWADVRKAGREFRVRQYLEGYQLRGERSTDCDLQALEFLTNWISSNYGGPMDTNLPSLAELSDRLANNPACTDPLLLAIAAVNTTELHEANRRLERAVKGFENSKHLGYPKFFAAVTLSDKLIEDRTDRLPVLDAEALQYLKAALTDGSIEPSDQAELGEILVNDWASSFFRRNAPAVCGLVKDQGGGYEWLALVLDGENEINEAWRARGNGYSDSVSASGWQGFSAHLASAGQSLTRAWNLHPELPLAPCLMMTVALGSSDIGEMRQWFDRTTTAQLDYAGAWREMRWGLRPRWFGDYDSMLAFGVTALNTRRFDTDVPRMFFDSVTELEEEMNLPGGQRLFGREDIWPHFQEMYEGYIAEPSIDSYSKDGWRGAYSVVAYLAGKYDVSREQLEALHWQPHPQNLTDWGCDLSAMPLEVAARTGPQSSQVNEAEACRRDNQVDKALQIYQGLSTMNDTDTLTAAFVRERLATLGAEQHLQNREWVDFLPTDTNFTGWHVGFGKFNLRPDGALEVQSDQNGHLIYSRARMGTDFEVRGQFEVVSSSTKSFQAGLVMGVPQFETYNWYAFRMKRNSDEGDVASFSQHWSKRQILAPTALNSRMNTFDVLFQNGRITATVDGRQVFDHVAPPKGAYVSTNEMYLGLGAFNDSNSTVIRYRQVQARRLFP